MSETLVIMIYSLLIVLIVVAIIIGIKVIVTLHKVDELLDSVTTKVKSLDRLFEMVDVFNDKMSMIGESVVGFVSGAVRKVFKSRKKYKFEKEEEIDE